MGLTPLPFMHIEAYKQTKLPMPDRVMTAASLPEFSAGYQQTNPILAGYQRLYGFDKLHALHRQGFVRAGSDRIYVQTIEPTNGVAIGTVLVLHGYLEHSGLYQPLVARLLAQHYSVVLMDLPGHGLSSGDTAQITDFMQYQLMLSQVSSHLRNLSLQGQNLKLPKPWLGIGQSTGAGVWMEHLLLSDECKQAAVVEGVLLLSPLIKPAKSAWWQHKQLISLLARYKSEMPRLFKQNNNNPAFLRFAQKQDPLRITVLGLRWVLAVAEWIERMHRYKPSKHKVWVAQGRHDQTVDWQFNLGFISKNFTVEAMLLLDHCAHQLVNERDDLRQPLDAFVSRFLHTFNPSGKPMPLVESNTE